MTSTERRSLSKEQYTVGWICALPKEMAAAKGMLDEIHRDLAQQDRMDHNNYLLGRVGKHNVVLASLPAGKSGLTPAATVAKDLSRTFPSIRFGLMVGIGGGVPSPSNDIRLGDIVVSQPTTTSGGVIQYDRGKTIAGGVSERTGTLNAPPNMLLTALSRLQAEHYTDGSKVSQYISTMLGDRPSMREAFSSPGASNDVLFKADYNHIDQATNCERCDHTQIIQRPIRDDEKLVMFYGNIASGDQVLKDGVTRDRLRTELDVLCFETEAAGLMWDYPCLVVRGICDYSDSHKNKIWQEYAAATAGAFAKELLSHITPEAVAQQKPIMQLVSDPTLHKAIAEQNRQQSLRYENDNHRECQRVFKTSTYENFKNNNPDRVPNTCRWVLEHTSFERWLQSPCDDLLWITADPGCGKSVLSKSLIDIELATSKVHTVCYFKDNDEQNDLATALCALLHQLFSSRPSLVRFAMTSYQENGESIQKESHELWRILVAAATAEEAHGVTCVLDALDECRSRDQEILINMLEDFYLRRATDSRRCQLKFLVTSRPYQAIERNFGGISHDFPSIRLTGEDKNAEISKETNLFIKHWVETKAPRLKMGQDARDALEERLLTTPNRTYLWLYLVLEDLYSSLKLTKKACLERIQTLPTTVEQAYERILNKHPLGRREEAEALLHIIVGSRRPLTLREMDVALQLAVNAPTAQTHEDLDLDYENLSTRIRELCGLFVIVPREHSRNLLLSFLPRLSDSDIIWTITDETP